MKIYFYSSKKSINSYLLTNEASKEAILIDPCDISEYFIEKLENEHLTLMATCITRPNIEEVKRGVKTWQKISNFSVFELSNLFSDSLDFIKNFKLSSFNIEAFRIKDDSSAFCMYKIENILFTGQSLLASIFQPVFSNKIDTEDRIEDKVRCFTQCSNKETIIFPFSGPPTGIKNLNLEKLFKNQ